MLRLPILFLLSACATTTEVAMHTHHEIDYIELSVTDLGAAKQFYADAFGWQFNDYGPTYCGIQSGEGEAGGMAQVESVATGGPLVVLFSEDLDATQAAVERAGGTIEKPIFDFPGGRRFEFLDPSGNRLAVWGHADK